MPISSLPLHVLPSTLSGRFSPPRSKSHTIRALAACALAGGGVVEHPQLCLDTLSMLHGLEALGLSVGECSANRVQIDDMSWSDWDVRIDAGNSATSLRFLMALSTLRRGRTVLTGDTNLMSRPHSVLVDIINSSGGSARISGSSIVVHDGFKWPDSIVVPDSFSSQFVSALLLIAPVTGMDVHFTDGPSQPYIDATKDVIRTFTQGNGYAPSTYRVPWDPASSAPVICSAVGSGGSIQVDGADWSVLEAPMLKKALEQMGCSIAEDTVSAPDRLDLLNIDVARSPDIFLPLAVLATASSGTSVFTGLTGLQYKESNRGSSTCATIRSLGGNCSISNNTLKVLGSPLTEGTAQSFGDHRVMMSAVEGGALSRNGGVIRDPHLSAVSYPCFLKDMLSLGLELADARILQ